MLSGKVKQWSSSLPGFNATSTSTTTDAAAAPAPAPAPLGQDQDDSTQQASSSIDSEETQADLLIQYQKLTNERLKAATYAYATSIG